MNDIDYCKGTDCPLKDNCARHILSLEEPKPYAWWTEPAYNKETDSCELYLGN